MEASVECFGDKCHLSMSAKVLMAFTEGLKHRGSSGKTSDEFVIHAQNVLKHEGLKGPTIIFPGTVALCVGHDVRLWERPIKPISKAMVVSNQCHLKVPFLPIGFGAIEAEILRPGSFSYELHGGEIIARPRALRQWQAVGVPGWMLWQRCWTQGIRWNH
jgi:hypothetical protein